MKTSLFIFICFCVLGANAQKTFMRHLTVEDGLPSAVVYNSYQDNDSWIWFCTDQGICKFNGSNMQSFMMSDGLTDNEVFKFVEDSKGRIWFVTANGIPSYYDRGQIQSFDYVPELDEYRGHMIDISEDKDGNIWLLWSNGEAVCFNDKGKPVKEVSSGEGAVLPNVYGLLKTNDGEMIGVTKKNYIINYSTGKRIFLKENLVGGFTRRRITSMNKILISKRNTLLEFDARFDVDTLEGRTIFQSDSTEILHIYETSDSLIWVSTWQGVKAINPITHQVEKEYLKGLPVTAIFEDRDKNIWLTTYGNGVFMIPAVSYQYYESGDELNSNRLNRLFMNGEDVWVASSRSKMSIIKEDTILQLAVGPNLSGRGRIKEVLQLDDGSQLVSTDLGLHQIKDDKLLRSVRSKGVSIVSDNQTYILTVDYNGAIYRYDYQNHDEIFKPDVKPFFVQFEKIAWGCPYDENSVLLASYRSMIQLDLKTSERTSLTDHISANMNITDFAYVDDEIWITTNGSGVFCLKGEETTNITQEDGLNSNSCKEIYSYGDSLFIPTNKGLNMILRGSNKVYSFSAPDNFPTNEVQSVLIDEEDKIWISTPTAVSFFDRSILSTRPVQIPFRFKGISLDGSRLSAKESYEISSDFAQLSFNVSPVYFGSPSAVSYRYKMHETDTVWIMSKTPEISIPSLSPGEYNVVIQMLLHDEPVEGQLGFTFIVNGPIYSRWWMITIYILGAVIIGYFLFQARVRRIRIKENQRRRMADARNKALRSQMNPHFVFNSLNSIQNFIISNDEINANKYLTQFSRLIRRVLDNSDKISVTVEEENELLEDYLSLEKLRLQNAFSYSIKIDPEINRMTTRIPSMLVQPFVENAVWHGVAEMKENGEINIEFKLGDGMLQCTIEDNGVGIESDKLNKSNSYGIRNSFERAMLLGNEAEIDVEIINRNKLDSSLTGTRVLLSLPFKN